MAKLVYDGYAPIKKGDPDYSPTKRLYRNESGNIIPKSQYDKKAHARAGTIIPSRATKAERQKHEVSTPSRAKQQPTKPQPTRQVKATPANVAPKAPRAIRGTRGYGQHIKHQKNKEGEVVRTRVNAKSTTSLQKQFDKVPQGRGVIFQFVNSRTGSTIKAVSSGRNHTGNIQTLRAQIAALVKGGMSWDAAFFGVISDSFDLYDEDGNHIEVVPEDFTNIIMYSEAA